MFISKVSVTPAEAANMVKIAMESGSSDKIEEQIINPDNGKTVIILSYEDYFMRTDSKIGITIVIDDLLEETTVRAISAGGGRGAIFKLGFGANGDYEKKVEKALSSVSTGVPEACVQDLTADGTTKTDVTAGWGGTWEVTAHADRLQVDHKKKNKTMMFPYDKIWAVSSKGDSLTIKTEDGTEETLIFDDEGECLAWLALVQKMKKQ